MKYGKVPEFIKRLRERDAIAARALEFLILTAARTSEVLNATWDEFDLENALWTIPAHRMKAAEEHVVPLSGAAMGIGSRCMKPNYQLTSFPDRIRQAFERHVDGNGFAPHEG